MTDSPRIITRTSRSSDGTKRTFRFSSADMRTLMHTGLAAYRQAAMAAYESMPLPTTQEEAWRRTDIRHLEPEVFRFPAAGEFRSLASVPDALKAPLADGDHGGELLLVPGGSQVHLASELAAKGVVFTTLQAAEREHPELLARIIGTIVKPDEGKFAAMAGAFAQDGVLLFIPNGVQVEQPLHSLLWGPGINLAYTTHILVWLEDGSSVTYVHESASPTEKDGQSMHAGLVEIHVGKGAKLRFVELQSWGEHVYNFSHERVEVDKDGEVDWIFGAVGSHLTKNFSDLTLKGQGSRGRMSGFYFTDHEQHLDHDTQQNHLAQNTTSDLLYKGALVGHSRSVWQGMIYVAPGAAKTDGYQANRNLVLSPNARADSIPGLEILADDVRCTHGATVGKIDPELTFYLESRGMPRIDAERLIVEGFFDPIMQRIPFEGVRNRFQLAIQAKMESYQG